MKKLSWGFTLVFLFAGILTGCASALGSGKTVEVSTTPNATVIVHDRKGAVIETADTPDMVSFKRAGNYTFKINKTDYQPETISIKRKFNHSFWLNFLVAGLGGYTIYKVNPTFEFQPTNYYAYAGYGLSLIGVFGIFYDIFSGSLTGVTPEKVDISLTMTPSAIARQEAQRQAEAREREARRQAETEARRRAYEEANRYDPSQFTVVPDDFAPSEYEKADLFEAVAAARQLQIASNIYDAAMKQLQSDLMFGLGGSYIEMFVSDLTFVSQSGTDIVFSSDDNAIRQRMTVNQRSGLQTGQKVRVYYEITRAPLTTWEVIAIQRR